MIRSIATVAALAALAVLGVGSALAQRAPVPSLYDRDCKGLLCTGDARTLAGPPPPCQGLLCGLAPYSMQPPVTASQAAEMQAERANEAAAAAPPTPARKVRHARAAKRKGTAMTARTPDPSASAPAAPQ